MDKRGRPKKPTTIEAESNNDAAIQVAKKKAINRNSPVIGENGLKPISDEENALFCRCAQNVFNSPKVNLKNPQEVEEAIDNYFRDCIDTGLRPGNLALYAVLGLSRQEVSNAICGRCKIIPPATIDIIKKAKEALATYRELLGSHGKVNPVTLIFWQKNYDGLKDQQDIVVTPNNPLGEVPDAEIIEQKYESLPEEMD